MPTLIRVGTEVSLRSSDFLKLLFLSFQVALSICTVMIQVHSGALFRASSITGSAVNTIFNVMFQSGINPLYKHSYH